jgi:hypothetical protein
MLLSSKWRRIRPKEYSEAWTVLSSLFRFEHDGSGYSNFLALNYSRGKYRIVFVSLSLALDQCSLLYIDLSAWLRERCDEGEIWLPIRSVA